MGSNYLCLNGTDACSYFIVSQNQMQCISSCPNSYLVENKQCVLACSAGHQNVSGICQTNCTNTVNPFLLGSVCVSQCSPGMYVNSSICVSSCQFNITILTNNVSTNVTCLPNTSPCQVFVMNATGTICISSCPSALHFINQKQCVSSC